MIICFLRSRAGTAECFSPPKPSTRSGAPGLHVRFGVVQGATKWMTGATRPRRRDDFVAGFYIVAACYAIHRARIGRGAQRRGRHSHDVQFFRILRVIPGARGSHSIEKSAQSSIVFGTEPPGPTFDFKSRDPSGEHGGDRP